MLKWVSFQGHPGRRIYAKMGSKFQNLQDCSGFWLFELLRNDDIITTTSRIIGIGVVGIDVISVIALFLGA